MVSDAQQDEATQRRAQAQAVGALDWLVERDETNKVADQFLRWVIDRIPVSRGAVMLAEDTEGADQYTYSGVPISTRPLKILENDAYIVGYDEEMKNPAWVAYKLVDVPGGKTADRPSGFATDTRTRSRVNHGDYTNSGYDRGHMAPNYAVGVVYGQEAQMETFLMSNIVPQTPELNRGPWKDLEQLIAKEYLQAFGEIWVITDPIYREPVVRLRSGVAVATAYFKGRVDVDRSGIRVLAFVMPQEIERGAKEGAYLVSVDQIEAATGLDLLSGLDDDVEDRLESVSANRLW